MKGKSFLAVIILIFAVQIAVGQEITYRLGEEVALLDEAFYAGEASDGSDVAGRFVLWGRPSNNGSMIAFIAINRATLDASIFLVDVGQPNSWRRLSSPDITFFPSGIGPINWMPDDSAILWRANRISLATGILEDYNIHGFAVFDGSPTRLAEDNWIASVTSQFFGEIVMLPILPNGEPDESREPVVVTSFGSPLSWPSLAHNGLAVTFAHYGDSSTVDESDVYVVRNLDQIIAAPKNPGTDISSLAPTSFDDPNVVKIRVDESVNFAHAMSFSQDGRLIYFSEDWNNMFNDATFFESLGLTDFDIMISNSDGSGIDYRFALPDNQGAVVPFPGGARLTYIKGTTYDGRNYATSLEFAASMPGLPSGDNDITTTGTLTAIDGSGTSITLEAGTFIDFPPGEPHEIQISTPISPVSEPQLPPDGEIDGIPVVREFGPDGTSFTPPITVKISYTDAEVAGLAEGSLTPYLFNENTQIFDIRVPEEDILERNSIENYVLFQVSGFSTYGLGGTVNLTQARAWSKYR